MWWKDVGGLARSDVGNLFTEALPGLYRYRTGMYSSVTTELQHASALLIELYAMYTNDYVFDFAHREAIGVIYQGYPPVL